MNNRARQVAAVAGKLDGGRTPVEPDEGVRRIIRQQATQSTGERWRGLCHRPWMGHYLTRARELGTLDPEISQACSDEGVTIAPESISFVMDQLAIFRRLR